MADDQIIKLLEEIRDIQRENSANYKQSLQNQQQAIAIQRGAVQRSKMGFVLLIVLFAFLGFTYFVPLLSWFLSWATHR